MVGINNLFTGVSAGTNNTTGSGNSFIGKQAGQSNTIGNSNSFFGWNAGQSNTTGSFNTFIGAAANGQAGISNATAIGYSAQVTQSNSLVLGSINGINGATADTNVGIGTTSPQDRLHINGIIRVETLSSDGSTNLCLNNSNQISTCSSSLRYKEKIAPFSAGLNLINRLQPITFNWKTNHLPDLGFAAEDVAAVEPLLVTRNDKGQVEGVKYDRINIVLVNAIKEQQKQITEQQKQISQQQAQIEALKKLLCLDRPNAEICKP